MSVEEAADNRVGFDSMGRTESRIGGAVVVSLLAHAAAIAMLVPGNNDTISKKASSLQVRLTQQATMKVAEAEGISRLDPVPAPNETTENPQEKAAEDSSRPERVPMRQDWRALAHDVAKSIVNESNEHPYRQPSFERNQMPPAKETRLPSLDTAFRPLQRPGKLCAEMVDLNLGLSSVQVLSTRPCDKLEYAGTVDFEERAESDARKP